MTPVEAMRAVFAAWEAADPDALEPLFCEDGVYLDPLKAGPLLGREAVVQGNRRGMLALRNCAITVVCELESGSSGMCEGHFASELAETGMRFDFSFAVAVEMHDGRIARFAEYFDTVPLRR
jgi:ketosteroid isomerase-like protein